MYKLLPICSFQILLISSYAFILVKTPNRTLYIHDYNGVKGFQIQCLVALEPINQKFYSDTILQ